MLLNDCTFRKQYPEFIYKKYEILREENAIHLRFFFEIPGLCEFTPETVIRTDNLTLLNPFDGERAKQIVFLLGMTECVSYFKAVCPEKLTVLCGALSETEKAWWKKLYFNGLGEFLYRNGLQADENSFLAINAPEPTETKDDAAFVKSEYSVVPVGGGKDSAVTASLLKNSGKKVLYFTVNDQQARTDTVTAAGGNEADIIRTYRTIDKNLLELNKRGFLNGHTPFSAIVAFLSAYCAYITGCENIILSNESSANESNIQGSSVNHQYSKSYEFERDFSAYIQEKIGANIRYFSLLRPFNELQIACFFASLPQFHAVFRSCNAGSKKNIWCGNCPKCLFVYCILSPFIEKNALDAIFGGCMLDKEAMREDFLGLIGASPVKPFECVGTVSELNFALHLTLQNYRDAGIELPLLLKEYADAEPEADLLKEFNRENGVPEEFLPCVKEMYAYVSQSR